jgi:hypothetical protein
MARTRAATNPEHDLIVLLRDLLQEFELHTGLTH